MEPDLSPEALPGPKRLSATAQFAALGELWCQYAASLLPFARRHLRRSQIPEAEYSDEDCVQSGFRTIVDDIIDGKIASIEGVDELLMILRRIIADKVMAKRDQLDALKRGGAGIHRRNGTGPDSQPPNHVPPRRERITVADDLNLYHVGLSGTDIYLVFTDTTVKLLNLLDVKSQTVAIMRLKGSTIAEIAEAVGVSTRTIDRRLEAIRAIWSESGLLDRD